MADRGATEGLESTPNGVDALLAHRRLNDGAGGERKAPPAHQARGDRRSPHTDTDGNRRLSGVQLVATENQMNTKTKVLNAIAAITLFVVGALFLNLAANEPVVKPAVASATVETIEVPEIAIVIEAVAAKTAKKAPVAAKKAPVAAKKQRGLNEVPNLSDRHAAWSGAKRTTLGQTAFDLTVDAGGTATAVVR